MAAAPLLPDAAEIHLDAIAFPAGGVLIQASSRAQTARCPMCHAQTHQIHSHYQRKLLDLPWQGHRVQIQIRVRKFYCHNPSCQRRVFTEPIPTLARPYARKTERLYKVLQEIAFLTSAEAAARIAALLGLKVSADALLDAQRQAPVPQSETPKVLGVDDFAFRKGRRYGTILLDMNTRRPIDILPGRDGQALKTWLLAHPGIQIVTRDRGTAFADAIDTGAPDAVQVADRFHLVQNLTEAFADWLATQMPQIRKALLPSASTELLSRQVARVERKRQQSRDRRRALYERVGELRAQGLTGGQIATLLGISLDTVYTFIKSDTFPERKPREPTASPLDRFVPYLYERWTAGCHNALQLWREIGQQGFTGSATAVRDLVRPWRSQLPPETLAGSACTKLPRPKALSWLLLKPPEKWSTEQRPVIERILSCCPEVVQAQALVRRFFDIVGERGGESALDIWLDQARQSGFAAFLTFCRGIERDRAAVVAGLTLPWSNGPVEGHVNRLKFLKRQGYGRAGFDLLRSQVLHRPAA